MPASLPRTRTLTVVAQDPDVLDENGRILRTTVEIPAEDLAAGPWGYRVHVIDYDATTGTLYAPLAFPPLVESHYPDPYEAAGDDVLLTDPRFHAQNVYALVMRTLARFERALGRRICWGFEHHQLKVAPHAFAEANAYYSREHEALLFGYFPRLADSGTVFSALSHDVIVHETTHALLDGLRQRFMEPSSPDQAAFHEGFSDIVALLSVFSLRDVVGALLRRATPGKESAARISAEVLQPEFLRETALLGLAEEMGSEMSAVRGKPLRRSASLRPSPDYLEMDEFRPAHRRGEVLVAAALNAFLEVWTARAQGLRRFDGDMLDVERVVEEGAEAADYLLTMSIRALDYLPPVHLEFCDFLSAMLTADHEIRPDDTRFEFRRHLRESFEAYGIHPVGGGRRKPAKRSRKKDATMEAMVSHLSPVPTRGRTPEIEAPKPVEEGMYVHCYSLALSYDRTHFEPMLYDPEEVFRFVWENRAALEVADGVFSEVQSVRRCVRIGPDGFLLRETVAEFVQQVRLTAGELEQFKIPKPPEMPDHVEVRIFGGGTLIFDEYGRLKYYLHNSLDNAERQGRRLKHLWDAGAFGRSSAGLGAVARLHLLKAMDAAGGAREVW
jgi:hypothetical protein